MSMHRPQFDAFDAELKLAQKLHQSGAFNGTTDREMRRQRLRDFIVGAGIADDPCGYGQTYAEFFEATYGERL